MEGVELKKETVFTKEQLLSSRRYEGQQDLVSVLIQDGGTSTIAELDRKITEFRKGKVKR